MAWTMREAAEVTLAGRKMARRTGQTFKMDKERMWMIGGFTATEQAEIERAVDEIEKFTEAMLATLKRRA